MATPDRVVLKDAFGNNAGTFNLRQRTLDLSEWVSEASGLSQQRLLQVKQRSSGKPSAGVSHLVSCGDFRIDDDNIRRAQTVNLTINTPGVEGLFTEAQIFEKLIIVTAWFGAAYVGAPIDLARVQAALRGES